MPTISYKPSQSIKLIFIKGFAIFGVQNGDSCYCGDSADKFIPAPSTECGIPCTGNQNQICGSAYRMNVYDVQVTNLEIPQAKLLIDSVTEIGDRLK